MGWCVRGPVSFREQILTSLQVPKHEGEALAKKFKIPFHETSAKDGRNVDTVFIELIRLIRKDPVVAQTIAKRRTTLVSGGAAGSGTYPSENNSSKHRFRCNLL